MGAVFEVLVLMPAERLRRTGIEAGSVSALRASLEPGSGLSSLENAALSLVHREGEAEAGDLLRRASPKASARGKIRPEPASPRVAEGVSTR